jgi:hypothetical protein
MGERGRRGDNTTAQDPSKPERQHQKGPQPQHKTQQKGPQPQHKTLQKKEIAAASEKTTAPSAASKHRSGPIRKKRRCS